MLLRVGNFFSGSFFFPAFSLTLLPPIIFSYLCFCLSSFPVSPDFPFFFAAPVAMVIFLIFLFFSSLYRCLRIALYFSYSPHPPPSFLIFPAPLCFPRFRISADFFLKTPEPSIPFATSPASSSSLLPFFFSTPLLLFCCSPLYETLQFSRQVIFCRLFV